MEKLLLIIALLCIGILTQAQAKVSTDSLEIVKLKLQQELLETQVKELRRDQLNYFIEKEIYKEVYSKNYDRINLTITFTLGLFGVLGFLGIKNINTIKKSYTEELQELKTIRNDFELKLKEFSSLKNKYDIEIEEISKTNQTQNNKIQILELKEKIKKLSEDDEYSLALETATIAIESAPQDVSLLITKSILECRLGFYKNSINSLLSAQKLDPENNTILSNLVEVYYFNNQIEKAKKIIDSNKNYFDNKNDGKLYDYLKTIEVYHNKDIKDLKEIIKKQIINTDLESKRELFSWNFDDIHWFHAHVKYPKKEKLLINYVFYLKGQINGKELLKRTDM
jgi:hypothetical protein